MGVDHVQLPMPPGGEDAARRFYAGLLGLTEVAKPDALAVRGGCWFSGPATDIHLGVEEPYAPWRKAHVALLVDDLDGLRRALHAAGVPTRDDEVDISVRRFYAEDPFGNRLELVDRRDGGFSRRTPTAAS